MTTVCLSCFTFGAGMSGSHQKVLLECLEVIRSTSKRSTANNQNRTNRQFLFTIIYLSVCCLEKGVYSEMFCLICVVLLKLDFDWLMVAYIALLSALLSRVSVLAGHSTWVTSFFIACFFRWISTEVVYLQHWHGWCHMKLQPSWRKFCVHHTTMHHFTSCKVTYVRCMRVYL